MSPADPLTDPAPGGAPEAGPNAPAVATIVAISTSAVGLGAAVGLMFGFVATLLMDDLGLSRTQVGLLTSVYFGATGLGSVAGGDLTDRIGARRAVALDLGLVVAASVLIVGVRSYAALLVASVLAGAGYALSNAGTNVALAAAVPLRRRAIAMTVKTAGVPFTGVVAAFFAPAAGARWGWPVVMAAIGALALLAALVALVVLPDDRPGPSRLSGDRTLPPGFLWFPVAAFFLIGGTQPLFSWVVPFFEESVGISVASAGRASSLATAGGIVGMLAIASWSDRSGASRRMSTIFTLLVLTAAGVVVTAAATWAGPAVGIAGVTIGLVGQLGAVGMLHAAVVDRTPDSVGRASGVTMTGFYLGALASPVGFGFLVDATDGYTLAWAVMACSCLASAACFLRAAGRVPVRDHATPRVDAREVVG